MALISLDDLQQALNIDLSDPNGRAVATDLISAVGAWVVGEVGCPLESKEQTTYFETGFNHFWLPTKAPVSNLELSNFLIR